MMGHPADEKYAADCLKLWGLRQRSGGPNGYPSSSAFVPKARGISVEWTSDLDQLMGDVIKYCLDDHQRFIVKMYFEPQEDPRKNNERRQCNMTLTLAKLAEHYRKVDRNAVNKAIDRAIGKAAMALSYPPAYWVELRNQWAETIDEKKVCNF